MKKQKALQETYADLLHNETNPELLQLIQELDSICTAPEPPTSVNWTAVRVMHAEQVTRKRASILPLRAPARRQYPLLRKAVLVPVLVGLVLVTVAFTFTLTPLMSLLLSLQPSGQSLLNKGLFVNINQSQTIDGKTVTLQDGYADASQIVLGYTVSPTNAFGIVGIPALSTQQAVGLIPDDMLLMASRGNTEGASFHFSSSRITGSPSTLNLRLQIPISSKTSQGHYKSLGTVIFNFTLPFHRGKVLTPGLRVTSHGKIATLERVSIAQSSTRIAVQGLDMNEALSATLQPAGKATNSLEDISFATDEPNAWSFIYADDFSKIPGTWTFTVRQGIDTWVFHFTVPA
ncbi:MAG TPA: DUF4179 domain-containing protein [Ktedonobacteraceae bacterium]|nr:DUF4179 domain-containing protein [Ktedonobacteraceae bacterium]